MNTKIYLLRYKILKLLRQVFCLQILCSVMVIPSSTFCQSVASKFYAPDSMTIAATSSYRDGAFHKIVYGNLYRESWKTPITVPIFDLSTTFANLTPIKQGGGMSSKSLRLEDQEGREYVLRSVYKNGRAGVPEQFKETVYEDIIQDLRVGAHPYGALPVPALATAAGIYHTNPAIYYLPRQERLKEYNNIFSDELYLFEERPNEGWEDLESFGFAKKIIGYDKLLEKRHKSTKHQIDQEWVLKSRLFDLWIGDYDRHDDQWRWAVFPQKDQDIIVYRPIPRDRDQAFFNIKGLLPWALSRDFINIQQRPLRAKTKNTKGFSDNAKHFDRTWLTQMDWTDWEQAVLTLQHRLTDKVIEEAFKAWPKEIYDLNAPDLIKTLKARRDELLYNARNLYQLLAEYVDVVGTNKVELFKVKNLKNGQISVQVFNAADTTLLFYERVFDRQETKEIRLYGLDGEDEFNLIDMEQNPILIRVIGGDQKDKIENINPFNRGKKVIVYDTIKGIDLIEEKGILNKLSNRTSVNQYDRMEYDFDSYLPLIHFGITEDDGFFLGGGINLTRYGFKKNPHKAKHHLSFRFSTETDALNFEYTGDFTKALGQFNFSPIVSFDRPIIYNFYGLGNNTPIRNEDEQYHRVRLKRFKVEPLLKLIGKKNRMATTFGPFFQNVIVLSRPDRISSEPSFFDETALGNKSFLGFLIRHQYDSVEGLEIGDGWKYNLALTRYKNLNEERAYTKIEGSLSRFLHFKKPFNVVLASRIGVATLTDEDYYFFHNNNIGGNNYLRGFRNNRYAGRSIIYGNLDIRLPLYYFKNPIAPGEVGLTLGVDTGRVWYSEANDGGWKTGISPGIWWTPYRFTSINFFYTFTGNGEENTITLRTGFFF